MVIYSEQFSEDLENLLYGLITWEKHPLNPEHAQLYVEDIINIVGIDNDICSSAIWEYCICGWTI